MLLVIDNYDSFTYNLVQYLGELGAEVVVRRNDAVTVDEVGDARARRRSCSRRGRARRRRPASRSTSIRAWGSDDPDRSACASATRPSARRTAAASCAPRASMHGKTSRISHDGTELFAGLPIAARGRALSLAHRRAATLPGRPRDRRRRPTNDPSGDPRAAPRDASGVGRAVPPRVGADAARQAAAAELPRPRRAREASRCSPRSSRLR